jgi:hypothetical protein
VADNTVGLWVDLEVSKLQLKYTVIPQNSDQWSRNAWAEYMAKCAIQNRTWYRNDIGTLYCTNLVSNPGSRRWVVFINIFQGVWTTGAVELEEIEYSYWAYEIE